MLPDDQAESAGIPGVGRAVLIGGGGALALALWLYFSWDRAVRFAEDVAGVDLLFAAGLAAALYAAATALVAPAVRARRRAERDAAACARKASEMTAIIESAPDATIMADSDGRIVLANAQAEALFGYARREMVGQNVEMLLPERFRAAHVDRRAGYRDNPRVRPMGGAAYLTGCRRDGREFPVEVSLSPVEMGNGNARPHVAAAVRDVSLRMKREDELAEARAEAEAASQAKSKFLSQMSHELRTPLNAVIGFAQMMQLDRDATLSDQQREYARIILSSGRNLLDLINDILDLSSIEAGQLSLSLEAVDLGALLIQAKDVMGPVADATSIALEYDAPPGLPRVRADELRLRQILMNLISNAIKYNERGGSVAVRAELKDADHIRVSVKDTGVGIPDDRQDELFTPFSRLGAEHTGIEGAGIGLALVKELVVAMDGAIGFESAVGEGSVFWIDLPVDTAFAAPNPDTIFAAAASAPRAFAGGYSLLYVEDNPSNLKLMEHLISTLPNVAMLSATTPSLGLDLARAHRPDVIVLDLHLPEIDGFELLKRLQAAPETCDTPVIALTAAAMPRDVRRGLAAGFFRYMTKPIDAKAFLGAVDEALESGRDGNGNGDGARQSCA